MGELASVQELSLNQRFGCPRFVKGWLRRGCFESVVLMNRVSELRRRNVHRLGDRYWPKSAGGLLNWRTAAPGLFSYFSFLVVLAT